ncbi:TPA: hypothetical protein ACH3X1_003624 [Trebouxia sp. C0004]
MATLLQDHLFTLKRDCNKADFASQVCVPYDLLEACNPGGLYKVQTGDNVWSVSKKLTTPAHKVTAYELVKDNYWADPKRIHNT